MRAFAFVLLLVAIPLAAAEPERGRLVDGVATREDASQTYSLYLPASYDASAKHPLLLVFDPGGQGSAAAAIFRDAAEEYGWIVLSANGTRSGNGSEEANQRALRAVLPEINRYAVDGRRIYAAGFSGTAILAWWVGSATNLFHGVIGVGGRNVADMPAPRFTFAHYGAAGDADFNNREMREVDALLEKSGKTHRFTRFDGGHEWLTPALARDALGWFEALAMKDGRRSRDGTLIANLYERERAVASALEASGHPLDAQRRWQSIVSTFEGLRDVDDARAALARLGKTAREEAALEARWDDYERRYYAEVIGRLGFIYTRLRQDDAPPTAARLARELRIAELQRHASRGGHEGLTARRLLDAVYRQTAFILLSDLLARQEYALAAATAGVATMIDPKRPAGWYNLGAALARAGDRRRALDALERAIEAGYRDAAQLSRDEDYAPLRTHERFRELLARLK